jgi:hypothetical protein
VCVGTALCQRAMGCCNILDDWVSPKLGLYIIKNAIYLIQLSKCKKPYGSWPSRNVLLVQPGGNLGGTCVYRSRKRYSATDVIGSVLCNRRSMNVMEQSKPALEGYIHAIMRGSLMPDAVPRRCLPRAAVPAWLFKSVAAYAG